MILKIWKKHLGGVFKTNRTVVVLSDSSHRGMVDFICFMGGDPPDKREPHGSVLAKSLFIEPKFHIVVLSNNSNSESFSHNYS